MTTRPRTLALAGLIPALAALLTACAPSSGSTVTEDPPAATTEGPDERLPRRSTFKILKTHPHDTKAYTQGLLWDEGHLIETTGRPGTSFLRRIDVETGEVLKQAKLPGALFGEGVARWKGVYLQLTWQAGEAIAWDRKTLTELYRYEYEGEGWGLTVAEDVLVMSNGTSTLQLRDPQNFDLQKELTVRVWSPRRQAYTPVPDINELEWVDGELWANLYQSETIARIDLETGHVTGYIALDGLLAQQKVKDPRQDVLNGIAYDPETGRLWITGKYWPNLYEIEVVELDR